MKNVATKFNRIARILVCCSLALLGLGMPKVSAAAHTCASTLSRHQQAKAIDSAIGGTVTLSTLFNELSTDPRVTVGNCNENIHYFLEHIQKEKPELLPEAQVLILFRFNPAWQNAVLFMNGGELEATPYTANLVMHHLKEIGETDYHFHVVLRHDRKIYDLSIETRDGIPEAEYYKKIFLNDGEIFYTPQSPMNTQQRARKIGKIRRYRFTDFDEMLRELRVRAIPATDFLDSYHKTLSDMVGAYAQLWLKAEEDYRSHSLEYLAGRTSYDTLPDYDDWRHKGVLLEKEEATPYAEYADGITVYAHPDNLLIGEIEQVANAVTVVGPFRYPEKFNRTDRSLQIIQERLFPSSMFRLGTMKKQTVVDISCGGGMLVEELREKGINAFGIDLALSPRQKEYMLHNTAVTHAAHAKKVFLPLLDNTDTFFIQAHAAATGIADAQVDIIYETEGVFSYLFHSRSVDSDVAAYLKSVVNEWRRILKTGGTVRIANIDISYKDEYRKFFEEFSGLRFNRFELANKSVDPYRGAIEIERIDTAPDIQHILGSA